MCWSRFAFNPSAARSTIGRTDFVVDRSYGQFKLFFTADSTDEQPGTYPVEAFLKFTDGSNLKLVDQAMKPPTGIGARFEPFATPSSKSLAQVNFKVGANKNVGATGFSYRISVQGSN